MSVGAGSSHLPRKRGRRPNLSDEVVRERMFGYVEGEIRQHGFSLSVAHLVFEDIVRRAEVSRAAAFRLWPTRDDFNLDVLNHIIQRLIIEVADAQVRLAASAMVDRAPSGAPGSWDHGLDPLGDLVDTIDMTVFQTPEYLLALAARFWLFSSTRSDSALRAGLLELVKRDDAQQVERFAALADTVMASFGFRVRPSISGGTRSFIRLLIVILEGASVRREAIDPDRHETISGMFLGGAVRDRKLSVVAAGVSAVASAMLEPIPSDG